MNRTKPMLLLLAGMMAGTPVQARKEKDKKQNPQTEQSAKKKKTHS